MVRSDIGPSDVEPTVFMVDDTPQMRASIERHLRAHKIPSRSFVSADHFLSQYDPSWPGCLLLDLRMKGANGLDLQRQLLQRGFRIPMIVISSVAEVPEVVSAIRAGAVDFLEKPIREEALLRAVREGLARDRDRRADEAKLAALTHRERQILELLVAGENYKEIASRLKVSPKTVEGHRVNLLKKLGLRSVVEAVRFVLERHLS
ncbi:MAG TPA: response regulator [Planctomycetota bacterium]|nr:response regulator [Planctomycetota bacterium]